MQESRQIVVKVKKMDDTEVPLSLHAHADVATCPVVGLMIQAADIRRGLTLLSSLPGDYAVVVVGAHLDRTAMVELRLALRRHAFHVVAPALDRQVLQAGHLYVTPPSTYASLQSDRLRIVNPHPGESVRFPFDVFLGSLAEDYGSDAIGVLVSSTGSDGLNGLKSLKERGGLAIVAEMTDVASHDPVRLTVMTAEERNTLPWQGIGSAIASHLARAVPSAPARNAGRECVGPVLDLLRVRTAQDFGAYKEGTLQRRIERRMAMASVRPDQWPRYVEILRHDPQEMRRLSKDFLRHATCFFRDPEVFDYLEQEVIPNLLRARQGGEPIRVWIAGCGTGEESYSLAILVQEQISRLGGDFQVQIFSSDIDEDAIAQAREGVYDETISTHVTAARLARFFSREGNRYRVLPELRAGMIFATRDILTDPPFSRLDLVLCRNLLIYLRPDAQADALSRLHFALREGGMLLLGNAELVDAKDPRFEIISKSARLYRRGGNDHAGGCSMPMTVNDMTRASLRQMNEPGPVRHNGVAEMCQRLIAETYLPATVVITRHFECIYSVGPVDRYLRVVSGEPTKDLLAMVRPDVRTRVRAAVHQASQDSGRVVLRGCQPNQGSRDPGFSIAVQPAHEDDATLFLVSFVDEIEPERANRSVGLPGDPSQVEALEATLKATRAELQAAIANLEAQNAEKSAALDDAVAAQQRLQTSNETLMAAREELESLTEEMTARNSRLQDNFDRQRTSYHDLLNVFCTTNVATLSLGKDLTIRFFTPATKALFPLIPSDIGRPLEDLRSTAADATLLTDAREVLHTLQPLEREIRTADGAWYVRRILPYRNQDDVAAGVVITFTDVTEQKRAAVALEEAKREAEQANLAKSRFLAAASHDLRQPLQTLTLLEGLLAKVVTGEKAQKLVGRLSETVESMSGMLNALLDINQIEAGVVSPQRGTFPINDLLSRMRDEFTYLAEAQHLTLRVMPCSQTISSDPRLLEQMIRNLLSNALKYTKQGKVLVGCRRMGDKLSVEVWDSGIGIPEQELQAIFEEYHQLDNAARKRSLGLGLGLSITRRLANLLDHRIRVRSQPGKGSVFAIEVDRALSEVAMDDAPSAAEGLVTRTAGEVRQTGSILIIEDDPEVRDLLASSLRGDGHQIMTASDGPAALELVRGGTMRPDLILADYNLPNAMDGLQAAARLRDMLRHEVPVIILTGDISTSTMRDITVRRCVQLNKPVTLPDLTRKIQALLGKGATARRMTAAPPRSDARTNESEPVVYVVDDDDQARHAIRSVLEDEGHRVEDYASCEEFLAAFQPGREACLLVDAYLPGMTGLQLLNRLRERGNSLPAIMITGNSDVSIAVQAMKAGASDFIEKPFGRPELLDSVERVLEQVRDTNKVTIHRETAASYVAGLTPRQRQIMDMVLAGHPSKNIAADLGISQRTVENHRAAIMKKTGSRSLPALARLALVAAGAQGDGAPR